MVVLEQVVLPEELDLRVIPDKVDRGDSRDHLDHLETLEMLDRREVRANRASRVLQGSSRDHRVGQEALASRASLGALASRGRRAPWEARDSRERLVVRDLQAVQVKFFVYACRIAIQ